MGRGFGSATSFFGQVSERFKELVLKTSDAKNVRGFESHSDRHVCRGFPAFCFCEWCEEGIPGENTRTSVLETPYDSAAITVPIDLALDDYEAKMADALGKLCLHEGIPLSDAIARIVAWKPAMY